MGLGTGGSSSELGGTEDVQHLELPKNSVTSLPCGCRSFECSKRQDPKPCLSATCLISLESVQKKSCNSRCFSQVRGSTQTPTPGGGSVVVGAQKARRKCQVLWWQRLLSACALQPSVCQHGVVLSLYLCKLWLTSSTSCKMCPLSSLCCLCNQKPRRGLPAARAETS